MKGNVQDFTWMENAKCREEGVDSSLFFPEKHEPDTRQKMALVREICSGCSVLETCREYAIHYERLGFWGGMTERERQRERRDRNIFVLSRVTD